MRDIRRKWEPSAPRTFVLLVWLAVGLATPAHAAANEDGVAVIVGNKTYKNRDVPAVAPPKPVVPSPAQPAVGVYPKKPVNVFRDCPKCPEMVVVPQGTFVMGSPPGEKGRSKDEGPHRVTTPRPFAIGKYEVTFDDWDACVAGGGCNGYRPKDRGWGRGRHPVIYVSWDDAKAYVSWLSRKTGKQYRLLTEAEWEYTARAGTSTKYSWGNGIGQNRANCEGCGSRWDIRRTAPVGSFAANPFGLHDMYGNVWEWVEDRWHGSYNGGQFDGGAWTSDGEYSRRVLRGGSWFILPWDLRSAFRYGLLTNNRLFNLGFRIARTL